MVKEIKWVLTAINVADGAVKDLISGSAGLGRPAWSPDGKSFLIPSSSSPRIARSCGWFPIPAANVPAFPTISPITALAGNDPGRKDARRARGTARARTSGSRPGAKTAQAKQITTGETPDDGIAPGPAGKLLVRSRGSDLALMNPDGSERALLRPNLRNYLSMSSLRRSLPGVRFLRGTINCACCAPMRTVPTPCTERRRLQFELFPRRQVGALRFGPQALPRSD